MSYDLKLERLIDGRPEEVFDAFTQPDAMKDWYQDGDEWVVRIEGEVRPGSTVNASFGPSEDELYIEDMTYGEVERPHRLTYVEVFTKPDGFSYTTSLVVTFEEQNGKTLMTIVQTGFPRADERDGHQGGWPGFLDRLEVVVASRRAA